MYYVYVLDETEHLLGVLSLHRLVLTLPETPVRDLMIVDPIVVHVGADQETAARRLTDHNLLALPVVDDENRLLGIITQDDIADVLEADATEDIERLGGSQPLDIPYRMAGVALLFRRRVIWLLLLFAAEAYTGTVLRHFEGEISRVVSLSFFIPLLIGTGGNNGSQVTTTLVRAMAVGEVRLRDVRWVLAKEVSVGLVLGAVMAVFAFGRAEFLNVGTDVGLVIAITIGRHLHLVGDGCRGTAVVAAKSENRSRRRIGTTYHDAGGRNRIGYLLHNRKVHAQSLKAH